MCWRENPGAYHAYIINKRGRALALGVDVVPLRANAADPRPDWRSFSNWFAMASATQASAEPHWMAPLVTVKASNRSYALRQESGERLSRPETQIS